MIIGKPTSTPPHPGNRGKDLVEVFLRTLESEVTDDKRTSPRMVGGDDRPSVDLLRGQPLSRCAVSTKSAASFPRVTMTSGTQAAISASSAALNRPR